MKRRNTGVGNRVCSDDATDSAVTQARSARAIHPYRRPHPSPHPPEADQPPAEAGEGIYSDVNSELSNFVMSLDRTEWAVIRRGGSGVYFPFNFPSNLSLRGRGKG
jgi:hypothetical protein